MTVVESRTRRMLGSSGIEVSVCGLGGNVFGPPRLDAAATREVVAAALDLGVNFVDTANVYGQGRSESLLGEALRSRRDEMVVATKFNLRGLDGTSVAGHVRRQAEESLRKLRTDHIDLYQLHQPRDGVSAVEVLEVLDSLVAEGKVLAVGVCNFSAWRLSEAAHLADARDWVGLSTVQNYYHLLARHVEAEVVPYAERTGMGMLPYHPLGGGFLTGKYRRGQSRPAGTRGAAGSGIIDALDMPETYDAVERLAQLAARHGRTVGELALAWLAAQPTVASVIAGVSSVQQLRSNVAGCTWVLDGETLAEVDAITAPRGVPSPERFPYPSPQKPGLDPTSHRHRAHAAL